MRELLQEIGIRRLGLAVAVLTGLGLSAPTAAPTAALAAEPGAEERAAIEAVVRDYLLNNPEIVMQAIEEFERREQARLAANRQQAVTDSRAELEDDPGTPVLGNPDGDVSVVEFFDYQCGYCKQVSEPLQRLLEEDPGVRLVMKELPILGPASLIASRAALAAERQDGYGEFHWALMAHRGQLDEARVMAIAEESGLDLGLLREAMRDPSIEERLRRNYQLAERLEIRGTPAFVVGETLLPGAVPLERLRQAVAEARQAQ